jgi:hypothetical protein
MMKLLSLAYFLIALSAITFFVTACGVKKPPIPAYSFPSNPDLGATPSPTPGFSNPSGPISEPKS